VCERKGGAGRVWQRVVLYASLCEEVVRQVTMECEASSVERREVVVICFFFLNIMRLYVLAGVQRQCSARWCGKRGEKRSAERRCLGRLLAVRDAMLQAVCGEVGAAREGRVIGRADLSAAAHDGGDARVVAPVGRPCAAEVPAEEPPICVRTPPSPLPVYFAGVILRLMRAQAPV